MLSILLFHVFSFGSEYHCSTIFDQDTQSVYLELSMATARFEGLATKFKGEHGWILKVDDGVDFKNYQDFIFDAETDSLFLSSHLFDNLNFDRLFEVLEKEIPQHLETQVKAHLWMQERFGFSVDANGFVDPQNSASRFARALKGLKENHGIQINVTDPKTGPHLLGIARDESYIALSLQYLDPQEESLLIGFLVHEATHNTTKKRFQMQNLSYKQFLYYAGRSIQFHPMGLTQKSQPFGYDTSYRADEFEAYHKQLLTMNQDPRSLSQDIQDLSWRTHRFQSQQSLWIKRILLNNTPPFLERVDQQTQVTFSEKSLLGGMRLTVRLGSYFNNQEEAIALARAIIVDRHEVLQKIAF